jgi:hypothetical protein
MWEFLVKKIFPRLPADLGSDVQAAHSVPYSHATEKVDGDKKSSPGLSRTAGKKTRKLLCPVCSVIMEVRTIGNLQIDQCPKCEGVFLDRGELRILSGVEDSFFQTENHKFLIYTPHGLSDNVKIDDK